MTLNYAQQSAWTGRRNVRVRQTACLKGVARLTPQDGAAAASDSLAAAASLRDAWDAAATANSNASLACHKRTMAVRQ